MSTDPRTTDNEQWEVHNHGPHEGRGTACGEYGLNGRLVGVCKIVEATRPLRPGEVRTRGWSRFWQRLEEGLAAPGRGPMSTEPRTTDTEPATVAGRALLEAFFTEGAFPDDPGAAILAIEREAAERASGGLDGPTDQCQVCEGWGAYCDKHRGAAAERATGGQDDE